MLINSQIGIDKQKSSALVRCSTGSVADSSAAKLLFKFEFSKYFSRIILEDREYTKKDYNKI